MTAGGRSRNGAMTWLDGKRFRSIDEDAVRAGMAAIGGELRFELRDLVDQVRDIVEVEYMVFDVRAEFAGDGFPVCVSTYDVEQREYESPIHFHDVLNGRRFFLSRYDYPLRKVGLTGYERAHDVKLVERVIIECFTSHWTRLDVPARLQPYIGRMLEDEDGNPVPSVLKNLTTGALQTVEFFDR